MMTPHEIHQLLDGLDGDEIRRRAAAFTYLTNTQLAGALCSHEAIGRKEPARMPEQEEHAPAAL